MHDSLSVQLHKSEGLLVYIYVCPAGDYLPAASTVQDWNLDPGRTSRLLVGILRVRQAVEEGRTDRWLGLVS